MKTERNSGICQLQGETGRFKNARMNRVAKSLFMLIAPVIGIGTVAAQDNFQWGVKTGINISTQADLGILLNNNNLLFGYNGGLFARYGFNNWLGVRSGVDFQACGTQIDEMEGNIDGDKHLNYLLLPLKAEFSASEKAGLKNGRRVFFATGPYGAFLLNANQVSGKVKTSLKEIEDVDFGWAFELGVGFPLLKTSALQFSLNYNMGINKVDNEINYRNKSASLNAIFLF